MGSRKRSNTSIIQKIPPHFSSETYNEKMTNVGITLERNYFNKLSKLAETWGIENSFFIPTALLSTLRLLQAQKYPILSSNDLSVEIPFTPELEKIYSDYEDAIYNWLSFFYRNGKLGNSETTYAIRNGEMYFTQGKMTSRKIEEYLLPKHSFFEFSELNRTRDELIERFFNTLFMGMIYREKHVNIDIPSKMSNDEFSKYEKDFVDNTSVSKKKIRIHISNDSLSILNGVSFKFCKCGRIRKNPELLKKIVFICLSYELNSFKNYIRKNCFTESYETLSPSSSDKTETINEEDEEKNKTETMNEEKNEVEIGIRHIKHDTVNTKNIVYTIKSKYKYGQNLIPDRYGKISFYSKYTDIVLFVKNDFYTDLKDSLEKYNDRNQLNVTMLQFVSSLIENFNDKGNIYHNTSNISDSMINLPYTIAKLPIEGSIMNENSIESRVLSLSTYANEEILEMIGCYGKESVVNIALENLYHALLPNEDKKLYYYYGSFDKNINQETRHSILTIPLVKNLLSKYIVLEPEKEINLEENIIRFALFLLRKDNRG